MSLSNAIKSPAAQFSENRGEYITIAFVRGISINYIVIKINDIVYELHT